jgi:hypothetical protein
MRADAQATLADATLADAQATLAPTQRAKTVVTAGRLRAKKKGH